MAKNYSEINVLDQNWQPRQIIIDRILAYSENYVSKQNDHPFLDILKN